MNSLSKGINSDVSGRSSPILRRNTEKARRTVMPMVIFSPESGGRQNTSRVRVDIITQGKITLSLYR